MNSIIYILKYYNLPYNTECYVQIGDWFYFCPSFDREHIRDYNKRNTLFKNILYIQKRLKFRTSTQGG